MKIKRLKAFTLLEMTIAMLLSALLIALTYASYTIILRSHHDFTAKNDELTEIVTLDHLLKRDFEQAGSIVKDQDSLVFTKPLQVVSYQFTPFCVVRRSARTDTFKVATLGVRMLFESQPVNEAGKTDELRFILLYRQQEIPYHYHKVYSSENLIQDSQHAIH